MLGGGLLRRAYEVMPKDNLWSGLGASLVSIAAALGVTVCIVGAERFEWGFWFSSLLWCLYASVGYFVGEGLARTFLMLTSRLGKRIGLNHMALGISVSVLMFSLSSVSPMSGVREHVMSKSMGQAVAILIGIGIAISIGSIGARADR